MLSKYINPDKNQTKLALDVGYLLGMIWGVLNGVLLIILFRDVGAIGVVLGIILVSFNILMIVHTLKGLPFKAWKKERAAK